MADNFNLRQFLSENKLTKNAKLLNEARVEGFDENQKAFEVSFVNKYGGGDFRILNAETEEQAEEVFLNIFKNNPDMVKSIKSITPYQVPAKKAPQAKTIVDVNYDSIEIDGIDTDDYPDFSDAYISYAEFEDGTPLTQQELERFEEENYGIVNDLAHDSLHEVKKKKPVMEAKQSPREKYLTRLVENALGIAEEEHPFGTNKLTGEPLPDPASQAVTEEEMVQEKPLPKYENIEKLMQEIEHGTNEAAYKHKMAKMKEVAEMLEARVSSLEEGEGAEFVDAKKVKQMKKDIMTLRKQAEKLEKEYDKKFGEKKSKKETQTENKMKDFNLRKFLTENKLTTNSKMLKENEDEEGDGWKYFDIDGDEVEGLYMDTVDGVKIYSMTDSSVFDTCSYILEDEEGYVETVDIDVSGQPVDSEDLQNDYELSSYIADFISDDIAKQLGEEQ